MADPILKSRRFRDEREADWRRLETLLGRIEKGGMAKLSDDDLLAIPVLYRSALSSLSVARATSLDQALLEYLETLCARAYFLVYGVRTTLVQRIGSFFARDWPLAARALWRESLVALAILLIGAGVAYFLVRSDPDWFYSFVPRALAGERDPTASTLMLRSTLYSQEGKGAMLSVFATFLFTHNAQFAIFAFALGFMLGVPTAFLQLMNGCMLGAFFALYASHGLGIQLGGWLMVHGVTELGAATLASAAGFHIGWAVAFPGERRRVDALVQAGRRAGPLMIGVLLMLFIAGALEGVARQLVTNDIARYAIALASAVVWLSYLYQPRKGAA